MSSQPDNEIIYINVPFSAKEEAKAMGARWDPGKRSWFAFADNHQVLDKWAPNRKKLRLDISHDAKCTPSTAELEVIDITTSGYFLVPPPPAPPSPSSPAPAPTPMSSLSTKQSALEGGSIANRIYLSVPFAEKAEAKAMGARWDLEKHLWYAPPDASAQLLQRWPKASAEPNYLAVPFADKDAAKALGARWDPEEQLWYTQEVDSALTRRWPMAKGAVQLHGEDRSYQGNVLYIDPVPCNCWVQSIRSAVELQDWDRLRRHVINRVNSRCECCGADCSATRMEIDARWRKEFLAWRLQRLLAVCVLCHAVIHMGIDQVPVHADVEVAKRHYCNVAGVSPTRCNKEVARQRAVWTKYRDMGNSYEVDLWLLERNGIRVKESYASGHSLWRRAREDDDPNPCIVC